MTDPLTEAFDHFLPPEHIRKEAAQNIAEPVVLFKTGRAIEDDPSNDDWNLMIIFCYSAYHEKYPATPGSGLKTNIISFWRKRVLYGLLFTIPVGAFGWNAKKINVKPQIDEDDDRIPEILKDVPRDDAFSIPDSPLDRKTYAIYARMLANEQMKMIHLKAVVSDV